MGLKREQYDVISNMYNMRRLNNKIELEERIAKVYEKALFLICIIPSDRR